MTTQVNFNIVNTGDKVRFMSDEITIMVDSCSYTNGKHIIANPSAAKAYFVCCGKQYNVDNTVGAMTVEDWYLNELVPKRQMLDLLLGMPV